jgi:anti-sigma factor ChrR (cupin superfamily)
MSHATTDEEMTGLAALYALGALEGAEARDFERHVAGGCEACAAELREFLAVAADLALAAPPAEPPPDLRERLLSLVSGDPEQSRQTDPRAQATVEAAIEDVERSDGAEDERATIAAGSTRGSKTDSGRESQVEGAAGFVVVRAGEGEWSATENEGVSVKLLFVDRERATVTTLVRMEPGARIPAHRHLGLEQCLLLEGDLRSGPIEMSAGDFNCSFPGSIHNELTTRGGALFLIVAPERYETLEPRAS